MRRMRVCAALTMIMIGSGLSACTSGSGPSTASAPAPTGSSTTGSAPSSQPSRPETGCPTNEAQVQALLGVPVVHTEGETSGGGAQLCAFTTSTTDPGALGVIYLRFPRSNLKAKTLAEARRLYGSKLTGHTIVSMPSWGTDAFLDESVLPNQNLTADFAWVPGYEVILGMHSDDPQVAKRRQLIDRLVAFTR